MLTERYSFQMIWEKLSEYASEFTPELDNYHKKKLLNNIAILAYQSYDHDAVRFLLRIMFEYLNVKIETDNLFLKKHFDTTTTITDPYNVLDWIIKNTYNELIILSLNGILSQLPKDSRMQFMKKLGIGFVQSKIHSAFDLRYILS